MIVRPHRDGDDENIYRLARLAFGGPREPAPEVLWSNQRGWHGLVAEDGGSLVGALKLGSACRIAEVMRPRGPVHESVGCDR